MSTVLGSGQRCQAAGILNHTSQKKLVPIYEDILRGKNEPACVFPAILESEQVRRTIEGQMLLARSNTLCCQRMHLLPSKQNDKTQLKTFLPYFQPINDFMDSKSHWERLS